MTIPLEIQQQMNTLLESAKKFEEGAKAIRAQVEAIRAMDPAAAMAALTDEREAISQGLTLRKLAAQAMNSMKPKGGKDSIILPSGDEISGLKLH